MFISTAQIRAQPALKMRRILINLEPKNWGCKPHNHINNHIKSITIAQMFISTAQIRAQPALKMRQILFILEPKNWGCKAQQFS